MEFNTEVFSLFDRKWALLTAGGEDNFNSMTISWGGLGTIWGKPVATVYVRKSRYTHDFMDDNEYFTVSFYPESSRRALEVFGAKSGRDIDKMNFEGLSAIKAGESVTFAESETTLVCRKLFKTELNLKDIPEDILKTHYNQGDAHDMYIGEVVDVIS